MQNLFALLGLETDFRVNEKALEMAYFTAQRTWHPDRFVGKPEAERVVAIERSQWLNDAYDTLKNPLRRAEHLLELQGITALGEETPVPPTILMEMMELREQIAEAGAHGDGLPALVAEVKARAATTTAALAQAFAQADYPTAAQETIRLQYLGKAMEEAHMYLYRLKAAHG